MAKNRLQFQKGLIFDFFLARSLRHLGIAYNAVWRLKYKLMQAMKERADARPLSDFVQIDDVYWGGEWRGEKRSRGAPNKIPFVAAVAINGAG